MLCAESAAVRNSPAATCFRVMTEEDSEGEEVIIVKVSPAPRPNAKQRCLQRLTISTPSPSEVILISDDEEDPPCGNMSSKRQLSLEDFGYTSPSKRAKLSASADIGPGKSCLCNGLPPPPKSPLYLSSPKYVLHRGPPLPPSPKPVSLRSSLPPSPKAGFPLHKPSLQFPKPGCPPSPKSSLPSPSPSPRLSVSSPKPVSRRLSLSSPKPSLSSPKRRQSDGSHFHYSSSQSPHRPLCVSVSPKHSRTSKPTSPPKPHCSPVKEMCWDKSNTDKSNTSSPSSSEPCLSPKLDATPPRAVPATPPSPSMARPLTSFSAGASPGHQPSTARAKKLPPMWPVPLHRSPSHPSSSNTRHGGTTSPKKAPPSSSPSLSVGTQQSQNSPHRPHCSSTRDTCPFTEPSCSSSLTSGPSNLEPSCSTSHTSGHSNVDPSCSTSHTSGHSNVEPSCSTSHTSGHSNLEPSCSTSHTSRHSNVDPSCSTSHTSGHSNVDPSCSTSHTSRHSNVDPSCSTSHTSGHSNVEPSCSTSHTSGHSNLEPSCSTSHTSGHSNLEPSCSTSHTSGHSNVEPSCSTSHTSGHSNVEPSLLSPQQLCHPQQLDLPSSSSCTAPPGRTPALIQPPQMMVGLPYRDVATTHKPFSTHEVSVFVQNYMSSANLHKGGNSALNYLSVVEKLVSHGAYIPTLLLKKVLTQVQRACDNEFVRRMYAILSHDLAIRAINDVPKEEVVWEAMEQSLSTLQRHLVSQENTPPVTVFAAETVLNYLFGLLVKDLNSRIENPSSSLVRKTLSLRSKWSRIIKMLDVLFSVYQNSRGVSSHPGVPDVREVLLAMICLPLLTCEDTDRKETTLRLARELSERLETLGSTEKRQELLLAIPSDYLRERVISLHLNRHFVMRPFADSSSDLIQSDDISLATIGSMHLSRMPYDHSNTPQDLGLFLLLLCHLLQSHLHTLHASPILSFLTPSAALPPSWRSLPSPLSRDELRASLLSICHSVQTLMCRLFDDPVFQCELTVPTNWLYLQLLTSLTESI